MHLLLIRKARPVLPEAELEEESIFAMCDVFLFRNFG